MHGVIFQVTIPPSAAGQTPVLIGIFSDCPQISFLSTSGLQALGFKASIRTTRRLKHAVI